VVCVAIGYIVSLATPGTPASSNVRPPQSASDPVQSSGSRA
jgi:hypothetical protein